MAKGLIGFNCGLPGGLTTMYVNDDVRDAMNGGVLPSGQANSMQDIIAIFDDFFGDGLWFVQPIGVNNNPDMLSAISVVFPNAYSNAAPVNYSIDNINLIATSGNLSANNGWGDGAIPPGNPIESAYTVLGHGTIARNPYQTTVGFPVFRASEIDFVNKKINITDETETLDEYCWIEVSWYRNTFRYSISVTIASPATKLRNIYEHSKPLGSASYDNYIGSQDDPYKAGGESEPGGGDGDFDGTSDPVSVPGLPAVSATDSGFITLFNPTITELRQLASYMWSNLFDIDGWKKIFADPMDAILGLSIVPVSIPSGGSKVVSVGNISTGITMTVASSQYYVVDCGSINVNEYWGSYLDYSPYTKAELYLPYIGIRPIDIDDIMKKTISVVYHIDILSGACVAFVKCADSVLYSFIGQCSESIPITGNDWTNVVNGVLSAAVSIGSMVATGGASAPLAVPALASTAVNSMKPQVEKSGAMSGAGGMLAIQKPYLILTRPKQALPKDQNKFVGYPSFITRSLSSVEGYTEIESVHLEGIGGTEQEISEIESLLKSGVIF